MVCWISCSRSRSTSRARSRDCRFLSFSISRRNLDSFTSKPPSSVRICDVQSRGLSLEISIMLQETRDKSTDTYRSWFCSHILHEDTAKQLQRKPPAAQQHVVRDHHPHKATVWTGGNETRNVINSHSQPLTDSMNVMTYINVGRGGPSLSVKPISASRLLFNWAARS